MSTVTEMYNKKFWEELIVYILSTVIWISDPTSRKKTLVCMHNEINTTSEATVLVLLKGGTYEVRGWDVLSWHDIHTKSHDDWLRFSSNIEGITWTVWEAIVLVLLMGEIYDVLPSDDLSGTINAYQVTWRLV
jgi:hypothetical protein